MISQLINSKMLSTTSRFRTLHDDIIQDIAGDYYGCRLATCSSDSSIKVWNRRPVSAVRNNTPVASQLSTSLTANVSTPTIAVTAAAVQGAPTLIPVTSASSSSINTGNVPLVSATTSTTTAVTPLPSNGSTTTESFPISSGGKSHSGGSLIDPGRTVPIHSTGLNSSAYEWTVSWEWKAHQGSVWKVAWAHPEFGQVIASCGFDKKVIVWEEYEELGVKKWRSVAQHVDARDSVVDIKFAPAHLGLKLATCSADGYVRIYEASELTNLSQWTLTTFEAAKSPGQCTCISWNSSPFERPMLIVGTTETKVKIWEHSAETRSWVSYADLDSGTDGTNDIAWAPSLGRSYYLIAVAPKRGVTKHVRLYRLTRDAGPNKYNLQELSLPPPPHALELESVHDQQPHHPLPSTQSSKLVSVRRLEWNITGTVLAASFDDGTIILWKQALTGDWIVVSVSTQE
ncbi:Nucleoporin seh1 [Pelomyxa schiedti]|nr:Nucleoporin seh1 [Pelomyxa schiedti]